MSKYRTPLKVFSLNLIMDSSYVYDACSEIIQTITILSKRLTKCILYYLYLAHMLLLAHPKAIPEIHMHKSHHYSRCGMSENGRN